MIWFCNPHFSLSKYRHIINRRERKSLLNQSETWPLAANANFSQTHFNYSTRKNARKKGIYKKVLSPKRFLNCSSKMNASTKLLLVLFISKVSTETLSGSCGCAVETVDSYHHQRIPSSITELYCQRSGSTCGINSLSKVSIFIILISQNMTILGF